jgi:hypothetical protein
MNSDWQPVSEIVSQELEKILSTPKSEINKKEEQNSCRMKVLAHGTLGSPGRGHCFVATSAIF